jgi:hypothetical protein
MAREPRDDGTYGQGQGPQLVAATDLEEAVATVLRMFDKYVTAGLLQDYLAVLADQRPEDVYEACKQWVRHPPENRAPRAHELREVASGLRPKAPAPWQEVEPPTPPRRLDAILAELALEYPDNAMLRWRIDERRQLRAQGLELDGAGEARAILGTLRQRRTMPPAPADEAP